MPGAKNLSILAVAVSFSLLSLPAWTITPVNTVNNGPVINGGIYFNTSGDKTTFINTAGTGMWLKGGSNIRAIESDSHANFTGNGGTVQISALNQVVRLDGNIDIRGVRDEIGQYLGSGGKLFVDAAYLFQDGNIYASGYSGGLVQFNVGSATFAGTARIEANGLGSTANAGIANQPGVTQNPQGGTIAINSRGSVDIQHQVVFNANGVGSDINIEGGIVNLEGVIQATSSQFGSSGNIRLVSAGQSDLIQSRNAIQSATAQGIFSSVESARINSKLFDLVENHDGDIVVSSPDNINQRGFLASRTAIFAAQRNIDNGGWILADGHPYVGTSSDNVGTSSDNGGTISLNAGSAIINKNRISANGFGSDGNGGVITLSYKDGMSNSGSIVSLGQSANGGGLIDFSGPINPSGNGIVAAFGSASHYGHGTVVMPDPATASNQLFGTWSHTQPNEVVFGGMHFPGLIFLNTSLPGSSVTQGSFDAWATHARIRNLSDQQGYGEARKDLQYLNRPPLEANPLIVSSNDGSSFQLEYPQQYIHIVGSLAPATSLTVLTNGAVTVPNKMLIGFDQPKGFLGNDYANSIRGHLSLLSNSLNIQSTGGFVISGKTNYLLSQFPPNPFIQISSSTDMGPGTANIAVRSSFTGSTSNFSLDRQDPSLIIKAP